MIAPARLAALDALISIETGEVDLGEAISRAGQPLKDERDRGLLLELVTGTLRMRGALDYQLARLVTRALGRLDTAVLTVLRMGAYQLIYLSKIPSSAAVDDAVELTRRAGKTSASGLVNAVLRALSRERDRLNWPERPVSPQSSEWVTYLSVIHSHPVWLIERWIDRYGVDPAERWLKFNNRPPALCIAANRTLTSREQLGAELRGEGVQTRPTQRAPHGLHIVEGNPLASRAFREGRCVVQDEASQLIPELIDERAGARVLDLCASPGGKTVALAAKVGVTGLVVASDVRAHRLRVLRSTLARCEIDRARVIRIPPEGALPLRPGSFDAVVIDAPCSGLGTLRRDPDIRWRRTADDLRRFAATQLDLLGRCADLVRPGGALVYSTCSSEPEENQDVVSAFLANHGEYRHTREHQTLPFRDGLEAFFGAVLSRAPTV